MMDEKFSRTIKLIGETAIEKLYKSKVAVFGVGGVGSYAVEALARSGVGAFVLIDHDYISQSNINRQIHSLVSTVGQPKVEAMKKRILDINPNADVACMQLFYLSADEGILWDYDYIIDAVDNVTAKINIILEAKKRNISIISAMGAGNKLDPTKFIIADIYKTSVCPLAKVMRKELKKRGIESLKVVYSQEIPVEIEQTSERKKTPASIAFMPSVAGLIIASEVVKDLTL